MASTKKYELSKTAGKPICCKAAVARKAGEPLVIEEVIVAPPKAHEVRLKIICTSLCHTDVTLWKNFLAAIQESWGMKLSGLWRVLEKMLMSLKKEIQLYIFLPDCMDCVDCNSKKSNLCSKFPFQPSLLLHRDDTSRFTNVEGEILHHSLYISSFSEYTVVDIANVTKIDPEIPPNMACLLSCGVSTGVGVAWKTANVEPGSTVVIFGLGSIGLAVAEGARLCGATRAIGVDRNSDKFEIGKKFGVTEFVNSKSCGDKPVSQFILEMTKGGADYCFECVGLTTVMHEAFACCRKGWGKTIVLGVDQPEAQLNLNCNEVVLSRKTLTGVLFGGLKPKSDIPILVKRYLDKELQLEKFITHEVNLEDINKAFDLLIQRKSLRCVIWMDK